jgi:hypothetical protein
MHRYRENVLFEQRGQNNGMEKPCPHAWNGMSRRRNANRCALHAGVLRQVRRADLPSQGQGRSSFLKKSSKKLLSVSLAAGIGSAPYLQKFFASFFQKRSPSFSVS